VRVLVEHVERNLAMLENEGEIVEEQPEVVVVQQDPEEQVRRELVEHPEILDAAVERKMRKFAPSGIVVFLIGVVVIALGLFVHTADNATFGGFMVGVGVIVVIIGICRFLIGLIRPIVPSQL
jgi:hypothetical protein